MDTVIFNIGGSHFELTKESLERYPETRLGQLSTKDSEYNADRNQYFFNRNPEVFNYILDLYRTGSLHLPKHICGATLRQELEYWKIPIDLLSECCINTYLEFENQREIIKDIKNVCERKYKDYSETENQESKWMKAKIKIWLSIDQPASSLSAKIFAGIFIMVVVFSVIVFALETTQGFRDRYLSDIWIEKQTNASTLPIMLDLMDNPKERFFITTLPKPWLLWCEYFFTAFFSLELIVHFVFCPEKRIFFRNFLNVLDLILFTCMWSVLFISLYKPELIIYSKAVGILFIVLVSLYVLRIFRIFRLLKHYTGLDILFLAFMSNVKDFILLLISFITISIIFGSFIFYAELHEGTTFPNMFVGIWWAVVTMTTVGYGDHYPKSFAGCCVGICCSLFGLMFMVTPIALFSSNFSDYFNQNQNRQRFLKLNSKRKKENLNVHKL